VFFVGQLQSIKLLTKETFRDLFAIAIHSATIMIAPHTLGDQKDYLPLLEMFKY
jgi:hypothetical protein